MRDVIRHSESGVVREKSAVGDQAGAAAV